MFSSKLAPFFFDGRSSIRYETIKGWGPENVYDTIGESDEKEENTDLLRTSRKFWVEFIVHEHFVRGTERSYYVGRGGVPDESLNVPGKDVVQRQHPFCYITSRITIVV